ncbi:hypothetical protein ILYODFUR_036658, partial [Ilyodon furcidens]
DSHRLNLEPDWLVHFHNMHSVLRLFVSAVGPAVDQAAERDVQPVRLADAPPRPPGGADHRQHHGPSGEDHDQQSGQQA